MTAAYVTVVITVDYPDVVGCTGIINVDGIKNKILVQLTIFDGCYGPSEDDTSGAFCGGDPCDQADNVNVESSCIADPVGVRVVITITDVR